MTAHLLSAWENDNTTEYNDIHFLRLDGYIFTKREMQDIIPYRVLHILSMLNDTSGKSLYRYHILSENEAAAEYDLMAAHALEDMKVNAKAYLRSVNFYKAASLSMYELDSNAMKRFREYFTPSPYKSLDVVQAEANCPETETIRKYILHGQPIPPSLSDTWISSACGTVYNYYRLVADVIQKWQIGRVYVLTSTTQGSSAPIILGTVCVRPLDSIQTHNQQAFFDEFTRPFSSGILDNAELRTFPTRRKDPYANIYGPVYKRGSMMEMPDTTMYGLYHGRLTCWKVH
jgi:hypothetical protein